MNLIILGELKFHIVTKVPISTMAGRRTFFMAVWCRRKTTKTGVMLVIVATLEIFVCKRNDSGRAATMHCGS